MEKVVILILMILGGYFTTLGCGCDTIPFQEATEKADEIFIGRVIEIKEKTLTKVDGSLENTKVWSVLFKVEKKWKGGTSEYVEVLQSHTSCDFDFEFSSRSYIVYAYNTELFWWDDIVPNSTKVETYLCTRNASYRTYSKLEDRGFDDRPLLDKKYPHPVETISFYMEEQVFKLSILLFAISLIAVVAIKKRINA